MPKDAAGSPAETDPRSPSAWVVAVGARHDRTAFTSLFARFAPKVKSYALQRGADAAQADELVQDVMLTIWHKAAMFDPARAQASTWVFTIARNRWIDHIRRERRPEIDPSDPVLVGVPEAAPDERLAARDAHVDLRRAIDALPRKQAELVRVAFFEDKTHREIASDTGLPLGTVKSRIRLALARLVDAMETHR